MSDKGITIVGLGPGDPNLLTRQAWDLLNSIDEIYLRARQHPTVAEFPNGLKTYSFDDLYNQEKDFGKASEKVANKIIKLGKRPGGVVYAVPGHPLMGETACAKIVRKAKEEGIQVNIIEGLSLFDSVLTAVGTEPVPQLSIVDAFELITAHHPPFPPSSPALIAQIHSPKIAAEVKLTLQAVYPDEHGVKLIYRDGKSDVVVENLPLHKIDHSEHIGYSTVLYIPPLGENTAFEDFQELIAHLRSPEGCPWDREQTHQTLRPNLLEETYEVLDALDQDDSQAMQEEFGDLLLQIVLHAQIASEYGRFTMSDIIQGIHTKLVRRHPHVFGDVELNEADAVIQNWERLKAHEREQNSQEEKGLLDSIASAMPALAIADAYQKRAARVGFDWPDIQGVIDKVKEELGEFEEADDPKAKAEEFGDLLFSLVNLARWIKIDPETALRETNTKFKTRFSAIEADAKKKGVQLSDMTLDEMDAVWNRAKN